MRLEDQVYNNTRLRFNVKDEIEKEKINIYFLCTYAGILSKCIS